MRSIKMLVIVLLIISHRSYSQQLPSFFQWDIQQSRFPVTHLNFNSDSGLVQFAILSDRTGGMNPGIYEDAVQKANLLQPQFIMSVGDLINGYSTNEKLINDQWKEFNDILTPLTVPFFYVPGNHDISNAWMQKEWEKRYGKSYYYFIYKNTLFLSLNSQDGGDYGMKQDQVNYFLSVIKKNTAVKWTFLFMHQPLWAKQNTGFEKIEAALEDRNYTVFAGHTHNYMLSYRNNRKYFILATTGGGTGNRGEKFGEFNHITWVTLNNNDPKVVNIKLDGIVKENIVDEAIKKAIRPLTSGNWLHVDPYRTTNASPTTISPRIHIKNSGSAALRVTGKMPVIEGIQFQPAGLDITVAPGNDKEIGYTLSNSSGAVLDLSSLPPVEIELAGECMINNSAYALPAKKRLLLDWPYTAPKTKKTMSGFNITDTNTGINVKYPEQVDEDWDWHGAEDCNIRFNVEHDDKTLYLAAIIKDDHFIFQPTDYRDKVFIYAEDKNGKPVRLTVLPDNKNATLNVTDFEGKAYPLKAVVTTTVTDNQLHLQVKLPLQSLLKNDGSVRLNIGYADQDDAESLECATLYWKPLWNSNNDYAQSGTFMVQ